MVTEEKVLEALKEVYDPEIPVNIVDLGLVYDVKVAGEKVSVKMTMTAQGCPMHSMISRDARAELLKMDGVKEAEVDVVWDPPWTMERISADGRKALNIG